MENINKLIQNTDLSFEMQTNLYDRIEDVCIEIDAHKERYEYCKKRFMAADAKLNKAIAEGDYADKFEAAQEIIPIVNALHETRERIKELTITKQSFYKTLMDHQKSDEHNQKSDEHNQKSDEHNQKSDERNIYVLPRQQVIEFLEAIEEAIEDNPDFKTITIAIDTSLLKK